MKHLTTLIICLLAVSLVGCAGSRADRTLSAKKAKDQMIGLSKAEVMSCAGVPARTAKAEGMEFLSYYSSIDSHSDVALKTDSRGRTVGTSSSTNSSCEVTVILVENKVQSINYKGNTGSGLLVRNHRCGVVVEGCIN